MGEKRLAGCLAKRPHTKFMPIQKRISDILDREFENIDEILEDRLLKWFSQTSFIKSSLRHLDDFEDLEEICDRNFKDM